MPARILQVEPPLLTIEISGTLTQPEFAALQAESAAMIKQHGRLRALALLNGYVGTARDGAWGDVSFQVQHDDFIERMAIVGEARFEDIVSMFVGKWFRHFPIEYFTPDRKAEAEAWIREGL